LRFLEGVPEGSMEGFALNGEWELIGDAHKIFLARMQLFTI